MSSTFYFKCPTCQARLTVPISSAGNKINCAECGQRLQVPNPRNKTVLGELDDWSLASAPKAGSPIPSNLIASLSGLLRRLFPLLLLLPSNVRKVLFFGVLGALGCLAGWLVGEVFLWVGLPGSKTAAASLASKPVLPPLASQDAPPVPPPAAIPAGLTLPLTQAPAPPPPPFPFVMSRTPVAPAPPPEFAQRLEKAGAKSGDVQITLIWFNVNDLDLHCIEPGGGEIYFGRRRSRSGGELDVDMNAAGGMSDGAGGP
jgi:ribosomal protein S27E